MRENNKNKFDKINRRIFLFVIFKIFTISYILERLYNLQIRQSEKYKKLAENNRINSMFIILQEELYMIEIMLFLQII